MTTTHQYRTVGTFLVTLTVTDARGATATAMQTVTVAAGTPPTARVHVLAAPRRASNQDVFFNASASRAARRPHDRELRLGLWRRHDRQRRHRVPHATPAGGTYRSR